MPLAVNWPFPPVGQFSLPWTIASRLTMASVGLTGKIFTNFLNSSTVHNSEILYNAIENRPANQPLITCSNHHSCLDEPLLWGMLKWRHHSYGNHVMRWATGASDVCFKKELHSKFFALGRTIPLVRGDGVYQKSMDFAVDLLNSGAWVHIYPEGKVNLKKNPMRLKWGIGRLISDCNIPPIVLPFWHLGMDDVLPNKRPYRLKVFKKITTLIGDPLDLNDTIEELNRTNANNVTRRKTFTDMVQSTFCDLEARTKQLHFGNSETVS